MPRSSQPAAVAVAAVAPSPVPSDAVMRDVERFWRDVREAAQTRSPMLAAALEHASLSTVTEGQVTLVFSDRFQCEQMERSRAKVEAVMAEVAGHAVRLEVKQGEARAAVLPSVVHVEANAAELDRRRREEEARRHPMIQKAQDVFNAKVTGIKTN